MFFQFIFAKLLIVYHFRQKNKAFNNLQTARSLTSKRIRAEKFPRNRPEIPMQEPKLPESMIISPTVYKLLNTSKFTMFLNFTRKYNRNKLSQVIRTINT